MSESPIFLDRSKLSPRYIPNELPHREKEKEKIQGVFRDSYLSPEKFPLTIMQIVGPAGIGKTSTVLNSSKILEEYFIKNRLKIKTGYVNLKLQGGNKYAIYRFLLEKLAPELPAQGLSAEEMLRYLLIYLGQNNTYAFIILDEIDYLIKITKDSGIIYDLTRLNEFDPGAPCYVKGVIFIARSTEFYSKLDQAELSTLGRVPIEFPVYTARQIADIISKRCAEAFRPKTIGSDIIDKVSEITSSPAIKGDIRYALDLLLYAGNLAESQGTERINLDMIRKVHGQIYPTISVNQIQELSRNQMLTLMGAVRALRIKNRQYVDLREIRIHAAAICEELSFKKIEVEEYLDDLRVRNIIEIRSLKEIGIHGASVQELEVVLQKQIKRFNSNGAGKKS